MAYQIPERDDDIVRAAKQDGMTLKEIYDACVLARTRISSQTGVELVNVTEREIAHNNRTYLSYEGNPNFN